MRRKQIIIVALLLVVVLMFIDIEINGLKPIVSFFKMSEPKSQREFRELREDTERAEGRDTINYTVKGTEQLEIDNPYGTVKIVGTTKNTVEILRIKTVHAETVQQAENFLEKLPLINDQNSNEIRLSMRPSTTIPKEIYGVRVDYVIEVPETLALDITTHGYLRVEGVKGKVKISNLYGQTELIGVKNDINIRQSYSWVKLVDIEGDVTVGTNMSDVIVENMQGNLDLQCSMAKVIITDLAGSLEANNNKGSILGTNIQGKILIDAKMTPVILTGVKGAMRILDSYAKVEVTDFANDAEVELKMGSLFMTNDWNHKVTAITKMGGIFPTGKEAEVKEDGMNRVWQGQLGAGEHIMRLNVQQGEIHLK